MKNHKEEAMKNIIFILLVVSASLLSFSCNQKMPIPTSDNTGLLVIPATSGNLTPYKYGYYYTFIYLPVTKVQLKVVPLASRNFVIIKNLPPGKYEISGIRGISSANTDRGRPDVSAETTDFSRSIPFEINPNNLTLLNYHLAIEQKFLSDKDDYRYTQGFSLQPLDEVQKKQIIDQLQRLENAALWNLEQLSAADVPDPDKGLISSGELGLTWKETSKR